MTALAAITETVQIIGLANGVGFFITAAFKTHKITDLFGAGSFVLATLHLSKKSWSTLAASGVLKNNGDLMSSLLTNRLFWINTGVIIWGTRLASYLFHRILYTHEDKRLAKFFPQEGEGFFDKKRSNFPVSLGTFWTIQALWGIICLLPVSMMNSITMFGLKDRDMYSKALDLSTKSISPVLNQVISKLSLEKATSEFVTKTINLPLKWLPVIGIFTGIAIETIADYQKSSYRSKKENDNHWCDKGLWSLSRYPNCKLIAASSLPLSFETFLTLILITDCCFL